MKILVMVPRSNDGGVANYFKAIKDLYNVDVEFIKRGKANWPESSGIVPELIRILKDYYHFWKILGKIKYDLVHINTFMGRKSLKRDGIYILLAKARNMKIILFFRGWDHTYGEKIERSHFRLFKSVFFKSDAFITLSVFEKEKLHEWGFTKPVFLETTTVDAHLVKNIDRDFINKKFEHINEINLLFLSRIEKEKGIYETIDAFHAIRNNCTKIKLVIAGKGTELENVIDFVDTQKIEGVSIKGFVSGEEKRETFINAHILVFPTYFAEGMPNVVLEAFAFGLPVVTTTAGGLFDIFEDRKNGLLTKPRNSENLQEKISVLINDREKMKLIALDNFEYANEKFISTVVVKRLENIYQQIAGIN